MRVEGYALPIDSSIFPFKTALCMLSGLQLDTLLVEDVYHDDFDDSWGDTGTRDEFDALGEADGWRQLLYYTPTSGLLGAQPSQPMDWEQRIKDGDAYGSVSLFRGMRDDTGMAAGPHRHNALEMISVDDWEPFGKLKDASASEDAGGRVEPLEVERSRPLLVFAKRAGASYRQTGEHLPECLRELIDEFGGDWSRIRDESGRYDDPEGNPNAWL